MSDALSQLLNAVYTSSAEGQQILHRLTREAGFSADNVISRLAIARSLADGNLPSTAPWEPSRSGKQIKGFTLLGRQELAAPMVAMVLQSAARRLRVEDLKSEIRLRWEHGLRLIELDSARSSLEDCLLKYAAEANLSDLTTNDGRPLVSVASVLAEEVVGQLPTRETLVEILQEAVLKTPCRVDGPIAVVGHSGMGRRTIANAIARAMQLPLITLDRSDCVDEAHALSRLEWQVALAGDIPSACADAGMVIPACVVYVSAPDDCDVDAVGRYRAFHPGVQLVDFAGKRVRSAGGALVVGCRVPMPGFTNLALSSYSLNEVAEIVARRIGKWPLELRRYLGLAGRLNPQIAIERGEELLEVAHHDPRGRPSEGMLLEMMAHRWGMDRLGLTPRNYATLQELSAGNPTHWTPDEECSFLVAMGLIRNSHDCWEITNRGKEVLDVWQAPS